MTHELSADRYDAVRFDLDGVLTDTAEATGLCVDREGNTAGLRDHGADVVDDLGALVP
jgi:beta-phosphoglucomutase-like phosphatase (HAD superfamily)